MDRRAFLSFAVTAGAASLALPAFAGGHGRVAAGVGALGGAGRRGLLGLWVAGLGRCSEMKWFCAIITTEPLGTVK